LLRGALAALFTAGAAASAWSAPVLMISIDGLKPEYVTHADEHGLKIPTLRRFLTEGTYADGVLAVLPTVTYPDHTTLITGVWPIEHGIYNNTLFDPEKKYAGAWYWYASSIKVPTLWDAAHKAGIGTASVSWPVSVNATSVDTLIPEYWRTSSPADGGNSQDTELMVAISRPDGALAEMEQRLGPYMEGNDTSVAGDATRTRFSLEILKTRKPGFMTIHLSSMDESEHMAGPFRDEADKTLEAVDGMVKQLIDAALANDPQTKIVIVSDHGFTTIHHVVNLGIPFAQAGLIEMGKSTSGGMMPGPAQTVTSWKAQLWSTGGLGAVMLHDPADAQTKEQVRALLEKLAADPANGIAKILTAEEARQAGGFPDAAFVVAMKPGYVIGPASSGPMYSELTPPRGTHGYLPSFPEMHSSFFMMGQGVARGRDLGTVDMRQIAPTVAGVLGVSLPAAKQTPLNVKP
jgi:predicted AlkP superfamily pyrophosphatase or phosphodiesterase